MYVNMHELASLAANRAQEMQQGPIAQQGTGSVVSGASAPVFVSGPTAVTSPSTTGTTPDKVSYFTSKCNVTVMIFFSGTKHFRWKFDLRDGYRFRFNYSSCYRPRYFLFFISVIRHFVHFGIHKCLLNIKKNEI